MIPLQLTIEGVYSYKKKQSIDFVLLTKAGVFGIFGSTGSGKSTIVESITYALYAKLERLDTGGLSYNLMNLQSNSLLIDFTCFSEITQTEYRFVVTGRRNSKDFSKITKFDRICYKKINADWVPVESSIVEQEVTGLSYDNFKRTVIIPQNHFLEFLHLKPTARTQMMKEIFKLHKYELSDKTSAIRIKTKEIHDNLKGKLNEIGEVTPEELALLKEEITSVEAQKNETEKIYKQEYSKLELLKTLAQDYQKLEKEKSKLSDLVSKKETIASIEKRTQLIQFCVQNFEDNIRILDQKEAESKTLLKQKDELQLQFNNVNTNFELIHKEFTEVEQKFNSLEAFNKITDAIHKFTKARQVHTELASVNKRVSDGNTNHITPQAKLLIELDKKLTELTSTKKSLQSSSVDIISLQNKKTELEKYNKILADIELARKDRVKADADIKSLKAEINSLLKSNSIQIISGNYTDSIKAKVEDLELHIQNNNKAIQTESIQEEIIILHKNLENGCPCPVCGSLDHPLSGTNKVSTNNIEKLEASNKALKANIDAIYKAERDIAVLQQRIQEAAKLDKHASKLMHELTIERNLTEPDKGVTLEKIVAQIQEFTQTTNTLKALDTQIDEIQISIKEGNQNLEKYKNAISELQNKALTLEANYTMLLEACSQEIQLTYKDYKLSDLEALISSRSKESESIKLKFSEIKNKYEQVKTLKTETQTKQQEINKQIVAVSEVLKSTNKELLVAINTHKFASINEVRGFINDKNALISYTQEVEQYKNALNNCNTIIKELSDKLKDSSFDSKILEDKQARFNETELLYKAYQTKHAQLILKHTEFEDTIKKYKATLEEIEKVSNKLDNLSTLYNMFKASGFVNFISTKYLKMLCEIANKRFSILTKHALKLEIDEKNSFKVRDYMNNGQLRDIKTLSGGQAFQAALSLALALSETVSAQSATASNFFFIDEGFGSQDKDSLQIVFETLRSLQDEGKIVGIISHVEELQEHIPLHISVTQSEHGSIIA